jgi:hypothetical protein
MPLLPLRGYNVIGTCMCKQKQTLTPYIPKLRAQKQNEATGKKNITDETNLMNVEKVYLMHDENYWVYLNPFSLYGAGSICAVPAMMARNAFVLDNSIGRKYFHKV